MTLQWQGRYLEVHAVPHGDTGTWEYAARRNQIGAAVILALTQSAIVLVEQHRAPFGRRTIELPAGLIGDDGIAEPAHTAAARELEEETGWHAQNWENLGDFATSPGMSSEMFTLFRATGLTRTGPGGGVHGEDITPHLVPLQTLPIFLAEKRAQGLIIDCRLAIAMGLV